MYQDPFLHLSLDKVQGLDCFLELVRLPSLDQDRKKDQGKSFVRTKIGEKLITVLLGAIEIEATHGKDEHVLFVVKDLL